MGPGPDPVWYETRLTPSIVHPSRPQSQQDKTRQHTEHDQTTTRNRLAQHTPAPITSSLPHHHSQPNQQLLCLVIHPTGPSTSADHPPTFPSCPTTRPSSFPFPSLHFLFLIPSHPFSSFPIHHDHRLLHHHHSNNSLWGSSAALRTVLGGGQCRFRGKEGI